MVPFITLISLLVSVLLPTVTSEEAIVALVADMEAAVMAGDAEQYLSYVDLSNETFAVEHTNWANDWAETDFLTQFRLDVSDIEVDGDVAMATMRLSWSTNLNHQPGDVAVYPVQFRRIEGQWYYAGEYWETIETEHFLVRYMPGLEDTVDLLLPNLDDIYNSVTSAYEYEPQRPMEIKIYPRPRPLVANTLLSLPLIAGWNEPAESLKLQADNTERLPAIVAHEFTHFLTFDQANHQPPHIPWWLNEGIAQVLAEPFVSPTVDTNEAIRYVQSLVVDNALAPWEEMADFETTPVRLWRYVYPQGYAFVRFVTETYGPEQRNQWIHAQATEMTLDEATQTTFGISFDELDQQFREWLAVFET